MLVIPLPPSFLITFSLWHLLDFRPYVLSSIFLTWFICLSSSLVHSKNVLEDLARRIALVSIPLMRFLLKSLVSRSFLLFFEKVLFFFLHLFLFDGARFQYPPVPVVFLLSKRPKVFLIWLFRSFSWFSYPFFHYHHRTFFNAKFYSYIPAVFSKCLYQKSPVLLNFLQIPLCHSYT